MSFQVTLNQQQRLDRIIEDNNINKMNEKNVILSTSLPTPIIRIKECNNTTETG